MFGTAIALRAENADLVQFGSTAKPVELRAGSRCCPVVRDRFGDLGGTNRWARCGGSTVATTAWSS
ncbi:hypothetical protein [Kutzneria kofuensis]|uniref:hypothetical protein n=1 Tax=Kutzneria kofuensis TaxID=103725 RepID=UPI0031EA91AC